MTDTTTFPVHLPQQLALDLERTSSGRLLDEALDAWLAEEFLHDDWIHVHSWTDDEELAR